MRSFDRRSRAILFVTLFAMILPFCTPVEGQTPAKAKAKKDAATNNDPLNDSTRWQFMLDQLSGEARDLPRKESRPLVLAEIADAYWQLNKDNVCLYLYYDMAVAATEAGNLDEAKLFADRITARQQRTLLYVKIAEEALRKKDRSRAGELLRETVRQADGVEDAGQQAAVFLAAVFSKFDQLEADQTIRSAIKAINRAPVRNVDDFSVLRKVSLSCSGDGYPWYGSSEKTEKFSLIRSLASLAQSDAEGMILMARSIEDPVIRIRALASIVQAITKN
jgi:hypothetical protein